MRKTGTSRLQFNSKPLVLMAIVVIAVCFTQVGYTEGLSKAARSRVLELSATRMGVDASDYLWAWNQGTCAVTMISPTGEEVRTCRNVCSSHGVDADYRWGVASLQDMGAFLRIYNWENENTITIDLKNKANGVSWVSQNIVAVSPGLAAHRVELWDIEKKALLRTLGTERELSSGPGAIPLRMVFLDYHEKIDPGASWGAVFLKPCRSFFSFAVS